MTASLPFNKNAFAILLISLIFRLFTLFEALQIANKTIFGEPFKSSMSAVVSKLPSLLLLISIAG